MKRNFLNILKQTRERVEDNIFLNTHRLKDTYFTRSSGKMRFSEAIYFILKGIKKTLQIFMMRVLQPTTLKSCISNVGELKQNILS